VVLIEAGYVYPAEYLVRLARQGEPVFFRTDAEWLAYMQACAVVAWAEEVGK
jgi:hypothetical protein